MAAAITVEKVYKNFVLPHEKKNSIKQMFTGVFAPKRQGYEVQHALRDVSFTVKEGEFFGIVGRNGSGKSTLLKMLAGIYQPSSGSVTTHGKLVPFIELGVGFNPELTGRDNIFLNGALLGFTKAQMNAMYDDIVKFAELERFMDQKLKNYSSGMQVRLAFSLATRAEADILLVDEVLAVGDADFQRKCFEYFRTLKRNKKTVVFVSHDMSAIREYCDRVVLIEKSEAVAIGKADKIASLYSRLFLESEEVTKADAQSTRWGDGNGTYTKVKATVVDEGRNLLIAVDALANTHLEEPNFGFSIRNSGGTALLGTNTHIKRQFVKQLEKGQRVHLEWKMPNVLADGRYSVDVALVYNGVVNADWWEDAARVEIRKEEQTPYPVNPDVTVSLDVTDALKKGRHD